MPTLSMESNGMHVDTANLAREVEDLDGRRIESLVWASYNALLENNDLTLTEDEVRDRVGYLLSLALDELKRHQKQVEEMFRKIHALEAREQPRGTLHPGCRRPPENT